MIHFGLLAKVVNMKTILLLGQLKEDIYLECSPGMKILEKMIASSWASVSMAAARQYNKKAEDILKKVGFTGGTFDPCLYMEKSCSIQSFVCR